MINKNQKLGDLGQHWTPSNVVDFMWGLVSNKSGRILEPSAGNGAFINKLIDTKSQFIAVEFDKNVIPANLFSRYNNIDFFSYDKTQKFDVVIGNPPYVNGKLIDARTKSILSNKYCSATANLYLHFIEKCVVDHLKDKGEIVFIIPSTFLSKTSRGSKLREWMHSNGALTHYYEKDVEWESAKVKTCIFRWVKGQTQGDVITSNGIRSFFIDKGKINLLDFKPRGILSDFFNIGVGAAPASKDKSPSGSSFIKNKKIVRYNMSCAKEWPRYRITESQHKILFSGGLTRDHNIFYDTTTFGDEVQASRHTCNYLLPKFKYQSSDLKKVCKELNKYISSYKEQFNLVDDNRISIGISECKSLPLDDKLFNYLKTFSLNHE